MLAGSSIDHGGRVVSGRMVLATVGLVLLGTAVIPPLGAAAVNRARLRTAALAVSALADSLRDDEDRLRVMARSADLLCGEGRMPLARQPQARGWVTASGGAWNELSPGRGAPPPDPWGNCYLVDLAARERDGVVWALSAGPDGIVDTTLVDPGAGPAGDDVAARIR